MPAERRDVIELPGARTGVRRLGEGPPLLLHNGYLATKDDWDPAFLAALAERWEVIAIDSRGLGDWDGPLGEPDAAGLAADALAVLDALGIERATLAGWSMGGFAMLEAALTRPERAERLVLLATTAGGAAGTRASPEVSRRLRDATGTPEEQARRLISLLFPDGVWQPIADEFGDVVAAARERLTDAAIAHQTAILDGWPGVSGRLGELRMPVLVAAGLEDLVIPAANALALAEGVPQSWLARFPGVGHGLMAQVPQVLAALIAQHADGAPGI